MSIRARGSWKTGKVEHVARATVEWVDERMLVEANEKCETHFDMQARCILLHITACVLKFVP